MAAAGPIETSMELSLTDGRTVGRAIAGTTLKGDAFAPQTVLRLPYPPGMRQVVERNW
jgi:hypothetical protein